jgi:DNA repair photolyase
MDIQEIQAKSILTKTNLKTADFDYSINPYIGCRFGCVYCYASFMSRFVGKKISDWGDFVFAKVNAPELLKKEITKLPHKGKGKSLWFSSVTDPYQGMEAKYQLTRKCLRVLADYGFAGNVGILTKSNLILRDIDLLGSLLDSDIGFTITSTNDTISQYFEKLAPPVSVRLKALKTFHDRGFRTYAFLGPLLPHILEDDRELEKLFAAVAATGNKEIYVEYLNLSAYIQGRLQRELKGADTRQLAPYFLSKNKSFRADWDKKVKKLVGTYGFQIRFGGTIYHPEMD